MDAETMIVDEPMDFGSLLSGVQHMPEREKIVLMSLIDRQGNSQNGEMAKIERYIGQMIVQAARERQRSAIPVRDEPVAAAPHIALVPTA